MKYKIKYMGAFAAVIFCVLVTAGVFSRTDACTLKMLDEVKADPSEITTETTVTTGETITERAAEVSTETILTDIYIEEAEKSSQNESAKETVYNEQAESHLIENFKITWQMPELPTGCEITAMTMALNYYGFNADKVTMATEYLPVAAADFYYGSDGKLYGPDLNSYFVGDPTTEGGYVCGTAAIVKGTNDYLKGQNSSLRAVDKTGISTDELYSLVDKNIPVVVWVTISMNDRAEVQGWYTESGNYVEWSTNDHGAVLIGYTEDSVTIADPISGMVNYSRDRFEKVFASRGNRCVILQNI